MTDIQAVLFKEADEKFREFTLKLIPTVDERTVIGVRVPVLRKLARDLLRQQREVAETFLLQLPHRYYEENHLHALMLNEIRDGDALLRELDAFLPFVDNWATCDILRPKLDFGFLPDFIRYIQQCLHSEQEYVARFGIEMLLCHCLGERFLPQYPEWVAAVEGEGYYLKMMVAWYFATALALQYEAIIPYLAERRLSDWIHQKTIQKALESRRLTEGQKRYLLSLR